jgi:hypothetical protein
VQVDSFDSDDGVWVVVPRCTVPLAMALRQSLIEVAAVRQTNEGQQTKLGIVYQYPTGPRFRAHVESIVERFTEMHEDLTRERKTMTRLWAKREEQIRGVIESMAGTYGDLLQGIAGLEIALLPGGKKDDDDGQDCSYSQ